MNTKKWISGIALGLAIVTVAIGALNIGSASAASGLVGDAATTESTRGDKGQRIGGVTETYLAEALGITEEELDTAMNTARAGAIDQALAQGLITQAQADELKADSASRRARSLSAWIREGDIDYEALLADALGISVDELEQAYQEAVYARIDQAVTDGRLTEEQALLAKGKYALNNDAAFQDAMSSAYEAAVQEAVANGVITQEQADLILENAALKDFGFKDGASGLFGFDRPERHGGRGMRGAETESLETNDAVEP
jgi:hypothetical protein